MTPGQKTQLLVPHSKDKGKVGYTKSPRFLTGDSETQTDDRSIGGTTPKCCTPLSYHAHTARTITSYPHQKDIKILFRFVVSIFGEKKLINNMILKIILMAAYGKNII